MQISCQYAEKDGMSDVSIEGGTLYVDDIAVTINSYNSMKKRAARAAIGALQGVLSGGSNSNGRVCDISVVFDGSRYAFINGSWFKNGDGKSKAPEDYLGRLRAEATASLGRAMGNFEALKKYPVPEPATA